MTSHCDLYHKDIFQNVRFALLSDLYLSHPLCIVIYINKRKEFKMNSTNWEKVYESILVDIVAVVECGGMPANQIEKITKILVDNDFMEKPALWG